MKIWKKKAQSRGKKDQLSCTVKDLKIWDWETFCVNINCLIFWLKSLCDDTRKLKSRWEAHFSRILLRHFLRKLQKEGNSFLFTTPSNRNISLFVEIIDTTSKPPNNLPQIWKEWTMFRKRLNILFLHYLCSPLFPWMVLKYVLSIWQSAT